MGRLENKIAIVTGASSGIGRACALMFAREGASVVAVDINESDGAETVQKIAANGGQAVFKPCNLRDVDAIPSIKEAALSTFGRIDILMNAAGVLVHRPFLEQTMDDLNLIFETNFRSYAVLMQAVIPCMVAQGNGTIVNMASVSAVCPELYSYFYGAMKAGLVNLSRNVAKEFGRQGIRVNCISPGPINTNMAPDHIKNSKAAQQALIDEVCMVGRLGEPEDIAHAAVYLASDEASFVTGTNLIADGGVCISN